MKRALGFLLPLALSALSYEVDIVGLDQDSECLKAIKNKSELISLQDRPPASVNGLRYRAGRDQMDLIRVLHAFAYYDASIAYDIVPNAVDDYKVILLIRPGVPFQLASYAVLHGDCKESAEIVGCCPFTPEQLGLKLNARATSIDIVNAELDTLTELSRCGYPLAYIEKRRVEIDEAKKEMNAAICVQEGPRSAFGPATLFGLQGIYPRYIERRISWKEGQLYDSDEIVQTQQQLMDTGLFSSVYISHAEELDGHGQLPMKLRLTESKHKQISVGAFYGTVDGPGACFAWTHRNVRGMGEIIHAKADVSSNFAAGLLEYKKPDFLTLGQSFWTVGELSRENIHAYLAWSYRFGSYIERKWSLPDARRAMSVGLKLEHYNVSESATNGRYLLLGLPIFAEYDTSDDLLNPTRGMSLVYQAIPYQTFQNSNARFIKQRVTTTFYFPLHQKWVVLALRSQFGSIAGAARSAVPLPVLFLGGSIDDLRGYHYKTVSPLNSEGQSLGGRSAVFLSTELRFRLSKTIGLVPFADFGTVTSSELPTFSAKWFKSVGIGFRYFAFFGPLRFDVGFPLDRRKGIDSWVRFYASVGQSF